MTLLVVSFLFPFVLNLFVPGANGGVLFTLVLVVIIYHWYSLDRRERSYESSTLLNVVVVLVAFVGLPVYVRSRGWTGGSVATLWAFVVLVASAALSEAGIAAGMALAV